MKFSGKRPVMFYQPGDANDSQDLITGQRIRIFYPDGTAEWASLGWDPKDSELSEYFFTECPCWLFESVRDPNGYKRERRRYAKNMAEAIRWAKEFDEKEGFPKMEFLGYL